MLDLFSSKTLLRLVGAEVVVLLVGAGLGAVADLTTGADLVVGAVLGAVAVLAEGADLAVGVDFTAGFGVGPVLAVGLTCLTTDSLDTALGLAPAEDFELESLASGLDFSEASFTSGLFFFSIGAGDISLIGVAGVTFTFGIRRLTSTLSPVSTEVSFSGVNSASLSSPVSSATQQVAASY